MLTFLIAIPFCQAADPNQMFEIREVTLDIKKGIKFNERIDLSGKELTALPDDFNDFAYPMLVSLDLSNNEICDDAVNQITKHFKELHEHYLPNLRLLKLSKNPITHEVVEELRSLLDEQNRDINIIAEDIGDDRSNIKG